MFSFVQATVFSMAQPVQPVKSASGDIALTHDPVRLRRRRIRAGLTVRALAAQSGYSPAHVSMLESGEHHGASPTCLAKFAEVIGCTIDDLMPAEPLGRAG